MSLLKTTPFSLQKFGFPADTVISVRLPQSKKGKLSNAVILSGSCTRFSALQ